MFKITQMKKINSHRKDSSCYLFHSLLSPFRLLPVRPPIVSFRWIFSRRTLIFHLILQNVSLTLLSSVLNFSHMFLRKISKDFLHLKRQKDKEASGAGATAATEAGAVEKYLTIFFISILPLFSSVFTAFISGFRLLNHNTLVYKLQIKIWKSRKRKFELKNKGGKEGYHPTGVHPRALTVEHYFR